MENNEIKTGLWIKTSAKWLKYQWWAIEIWDKSYWINVFKNTKKEEWSKSPDYQLFLREK